MEAVDVMFILCSDWVFRTGMLSLGRESDTAKIRIWRHFGWSACYPLLFVFPGLCQLELWWRSAQEVNSLLKHCRASFLSFFSVLSFPIPSYPILSCPIVPYPLLSCPIPSCPLLSSPPLSSPLLFYPNLSCPILYTTLFGCCDLSVVLVFRKTFAVDWIDVACGYSRLPSSQPPDGRRLYTQARIDEDESRTGFRNISQPPHSSWSLLPPGSSRKQTVSAPGFKPFAMRPDPRRS